MVMPRKLTDEHGNILVIIDTYIEVIITANIINVVIVVIIDRDIIKFISFLFKVNAFSFCNI